MRAEQDSGAARTRRHRASKAESLSQLRASFYPPREVDDAGHLAIDRMPEWGVPPGTFAALRARLGPKLKSTDPAEARSALGEVVAEDAKHSDRRGYTLARRKPAPYP